MGRKTKSELREIQGSFAKAVMRPLTKGYGMQPKWTDGRATKTAVADFIKPNERLSSFERIEIYNKQYWFRLIDSLYDDFPGLRAVLGESRFHRMSIAYLAKHPSTSFTLRDLGQHLPKFLARNPVWTAPRLVLARDVIALEWAHIVAFDGEELPALDIDELLAGAKPTTLRLRFQPHLTFLACDYPVDDFLIATKRRAEPRGEASNAISEKRVRARVRKVQLPRPAKTYIAVHRQEESVWYKRLEPEAYRICRALAHGLTLEAAIGRAVGRRKIDEAFTGRLREWFGQWAAFGWFCGLGDSLRSED